MEDQKRIDRVITILYGSNDDLSLLIQNYLEEQGYLMRVVSNRKEAIKSFLNNQPDLILADHSNLGFDGEGLLESVRATPEGKTIPFILIHGMSIPDDSTLALIVAMGAEFITGPFRPSQLLNMIKTCLKEPF